MAFALTSDIRQAFLSGFRGIQKPRHFNSSVVLTAFVLPSRSVSWFLHFISYPLPRSAIPRSNQGMQNPFQPLANVTPAQVIQAGRGFAVYCHVRNCSSRTAGGPLIFRAVENIKTRMAKTVPAWTPGPFSPLFPQPAFSYCLATLLSVAFSAPSSLMSQKMHPGHSY